MNTKNAVFLSCLLGGIVCWYDFVIFGIATAMVFSKLFFSGMSFLIPTLVFAIGFFSRPIGSLLFGNLGDRFGRKPTLIATLLLTAVSTIAIGLMPTYATIGIAAPIILFGLRILQTLALGGEWGATSTILLEYNAKSKHKGLWGGILNSSVLIASILATLMFTLITTSLSTEEFMSWGWRIPFLFSAVLLIVGMYVRVKVLETPQFFQLKTNNQLTPIPVLTLFKKHWKTLLPAIGVQQSGGAFYYVVLFFGMAYLTNTLKIPKVELTETWFHWSFLALGMSIFFAWLSDKFKSTFVGSVRMCQISMVLAILLAYPTFYYLSVGNFAMAILLGVCLSTMMYWGVLPIVFTEIFPTEVRQTGSGAALSMAGIISGGIVPLVCTAIVDIRGNIVDLTYLFVPLALISLISSMFLINKKPELETNG